MSIPEIPAPTPGATSVSRWVLPGVAVAAILLTAWAVLGSREEAPEPPREETAAVGRLEVSLTPAGLVNLDDWLTPEEGMVERSSFRFEGLEPRTYDLKAWREGFQESRRKVTIIAGETSTVNLVLERW